MALNVKDFGAPANGVDDDAPAVQAALDQLAAMGGGTVVFPPGQYVLASPVQRVFTNAASAVSICGHGSASPVAVRGGSNTVLLLGGIESLLLQGMVFVGTPGVFPDVATVLRLNNCLVATLRNCHFNGIAVNAPGNAVVYAHTTDLHLKTCAFRGSTGNQYYNVPVVMVEHWLGLSVEDTEFIDFGTLNGVGHSRPRSPPADGCGRGTRRGW